MDANTAGAAAPPGGASYAQGDRSLAANPYYLLALVSLISASQIIDRLLFSIVLEPVKQEFGLSDAQAGFVNTTVFSVTYALACLPLAAAADRWSRKGIIAISLAFWSTFTALTGMAMNFATLVIARALVGSGEAGAGPVMFTMLSQRFPPETRAGALGIVTAVGAVGGFAAFWGGGYVVDHFGWRWLFFIFGLPGLALAALFYLTIKEPPRFDAGGKKATLTIPELARVLLRPSVLNFFAAGVWGQVAFGGLLAWSPAYLIRTYGLSATETGFWVGIAGALSGVGGAILGGFIANYLNKRTPNGNLWLAFFAYLFYIPLNASIYLAGSQQLTLAMVLIAATVGGLAIGPMAAHVMLYLPQRSRATAFAALSLSSVLIGSIGPTLIGVISDYATAQGIENGLRTGLLTTGCLGVFCLFHLLYLIFTGDKRSAEVERLLN